MFSGTFLLNAVEGSWLLMTTCAHYSVKCGKKTVLATDITRQTPSSDFADFTFNKKRQFHQVQVLNWRIQLLWTALQVWIFTLRRWISIVCCYSGLTRFSTFQLVSDYSKTYYSKISNLRLNNRLVTHLHFFLKTFSYKVCKGDGVAVEEE